MFMIRITKLDRKKHLQLDPVETFCSCCFRLLFSPIIGLIASVSGLSEALITIGA